jgi:2-C-methyl-D-erythritol 4-phosphate cytidylyltransferase
MAAEVPKQYLSLMGRTVLEHSLRALLACTSIEAVMVALRPDDTRPASMTLFDDERVLRITGGATRAESVLAALKALEQVAAPRDWVLVHDAARPCVLPADIVNLVSVVRGSDVGGILAEPMVDTVKLAAQDGSVERTLDRSHLWRAQTPQMFRLALLREALEDALDSGALVTDEASAMELAGHGVQLVAGSPGNLKVTLPEDLALAEFYLQARGSLS